ncbi:complex I subunit 5 family protein [Nesterenkonia alba]|uniref:complex I subunit 5 family protein n=1 Tax=Nesterenkonia alba TaxID=515814 RepID=UPI000688BF90|nr:proton-conducting transporter membrane subunit [Nesterenkonia alba]
MVSEFLASEFLASQSLGAVVLLPLAAAALCVLAPRAERSVGLVGVLVSAGLSIPIVAAVSSGQTLQLVLGGFDAPLGIHLRADGLSVVFLVLTHAVGVVVSGYAAASATTPRGLWALWLGCLAGLNAVFVSGDLFNTYVGLELVGLTAVALVALGGRSAWRPGLRYLFVAVLGSLLFLIGVGVIVSATGTLDIEQAAGVFAAEEDLAPAAVTALALITVGLCLKLALVPMHAWLVAAHAAAPSAVSPLLSGLVIKAALFVVLRCWLYLTGADLAGSSGATTLVWVLGGLGAAAVIGGSVMALRQTALKPLVAYSTVAQVGYWFLAFPLLLDPDAAEGAFAGIVALALGHGVAKVGLFLAAGYLKDTFGTDEIEALRGAGHHHPLVVMSIGLVGVGLIGLPISLGFTGKWQVATAAVEAGQWWILAVLVAGTLLAAGYLVRVIAPLLMEEFLGHETPPETRNFRAPTGLAVLTLGVLTIVTGFGGVWINELLEVNAPW